MVAGLCAVIKDVLPFMLLGGARAQHYRLNLVGLRRAGIDNARLRTLSEALRRLRRRQTLDGLPPTPEIEHLRAWLATTSRRGIHAFAGGARQPAGDEQ